MHLATTKQIMPTILSKNGAAHYKLQIGMKSAVAARICSPKKMLSGAPRMVIFKRRFLKLRYVSVFIRHDLGDAVGLIHLSQGFSAGGPRSYSKTKEITA